MAPRRRRLSPCRGQGRAPRARRGCGAPWNRKFSASEVDRRVLRCSTRSSDACRRAIAPPTPPTPLARTLVRGSIAFPDRAHEEGFPLSLSRDGLSGIARGSPERAGGLIEPVASPTLFMVARTRFQGGLTAQNLLEASARTAPGRSTGGPRWRSIRVRSSAIAVLVAELQLGPAGRGAA